MAEQPNATLGGPALTGHLDDEELAAVIDGRCKAADAARVHEHLDACEECFEVFSAVLRHQGSLGGDVLPFEKRRKVWPWAAASVAALLVLGVGGMLWRTPKTGPNLSV